ncbi:MAG: hypothetical protein J0I21_07210 [Alphaproteobacteria bacterium]|nr:hypothetical protein [Alphaproteobacteria bacterium]
MAKITKRAVDALQPSKGQDVFIWDSELRGFGVRVKPSGVKTFLIQTRQRSRQSLPVADEYDVQDLLHAILKLHFDDVRPEEWTPSYAGNASRIDFFLPRERMIIEAKMTRQSLGQKEVANELIVDVARYAKFPNVDRLVCLIYDPARRCTNPAALENDLGNSEGRLRVVAVVCPRGT